MQNPVIVIPGLLGSTLQDEYTIPNQELWSAVLNQAYEKISLHPDDTRYEALEPAWIRPRSAIDLMYQELVQMLRHELSPTQDQPTPVFLFPYDWRQTLARTGQQLSAFVDEVLARTKLLRHYKDARQNMKVDLVGHSMGGLVICEYLSQFGARKNVSKVVTLATPFHGSLEAVAKLLTGIGYLTGSQPSERERELARSCPSIYQLLPAFPGAVTSTDTTLTTDLFNLETWQPSLLQTLKEYVRLYSVDANDATDVATARNMLTAFLTEAKALHARVDALNLVDAGLSPQQWLAIVGLGEKTRVAVEISRKDNSPWFSISDNDFKETWWENDMNSTLTGDGTVPLASAIPSFLSPASVVGVTGSDFGMFEWQDRVMNGMIGLHAQLPNMDLVQRLVVKHLKPEYSGQVWGWATPGQQNRWAPPIAGLTQKRW